MKPNHVASRSGISLNAVMPSIANLSIFETGYFEEPEKRSARSYSIPVCLKPTHDTRPRMKRCRSRESRSAATTRRLISRKSPVSTGIETFVEPPDDAVEQRRGEQLEAALAGAPAARRVDDVVAVAKLGEEVVDQLGRVLQVAVHQHDRVAARRVEPGGRRDLVAEVARERDDAQVRVGVGRAEQLLERRVAAAVVDQDHLVRGGRDGQPARSRCGCGGGARRRCRPR